MIFYLLSALLGAAMMIAFGALISSKNLIQATVALDGLTTLLGGTLLVLASLLPAPLLLDLSLAGVLFSLALILLLVRYLEKGI